VLLLCAITAAVLWLGPLPPRVVVMTTGTAGSDYDLIGQEYRAILRRSGIDLRLMPSAGGVDNLKRLNDSRSGVTVGFSQAGLTNKTQSSDLESLGTVMYEPFWFFCRGDLGGSRFGGLRDKKVSIGPEGGGARVLALKFLAMNGIDESLAQFLPLTAVQAGDALLHGEIDAAFMVTSWDSEVVRKLVASSEISVVSFPRADAYKALFPFLNKLTLPMGVGDLATNRPPSDVSLLAPKASSIVRRNLHPAIQYLLLEAAAEIHSTPNIFQNSGQFPAAEPNDLPLSRHARYFYRDGPPFLQRYLPFWLVVLGSRLLLIYWFPLIGIAYPLVHFSPSLYNWAVRRRILGLYVELKSIELELKAPGHSSDDAVARLDRLEERANQLRLPVAFANLLYEVRSHIELVRTRLTASGGVHGGTESYGASSIAAGTTSRTVPPGAAHCRARTRPSGKSARPDSQS
jgi:TRAP-type uncharacterized transport system substrate-binding protein